MRKALVITCVFMATASLSVVTGHAQERVETSELFVRSDQTECPSASFHSIQNAIDAARPGDAIHVCRGEYQEQVVIQKSLKLVADPGVMLVPSHMSRNAFSLSSGEPLSAAILVRDAESVDVVGFTVDAAQNEIVGCTPRLVGILYQNASGSIAGNNVRHVKLDSSLSACESGNSIEVQSGKGGHSEVDIHDNAVDEYQQNAITANGKGTHVGIDENEITIPDPVARPSQNGIQIGFGATGVIENNTITADLSAEAMPARCAPNAVGVLVFQSDGVFIVANSIQSKQIGVMVMGNHTKISGNNFSNCSPIRGIALLGDENEVTDNELPSGGLAAVMVRGSKNQIQRNQLSGTARYILDITDFGDNIVADNDFVDVPPQGAFLSTALIYSPSK